MALLQAKQLWQAASESTPGPNLLHRAHHTLACFSCQGCGSCDRQRSRHPAPHLLYHGHHTLACTSCQGCLSPSAAASHPRQALQGCMHCMAACQGFLGHVLLQEGQQGGQHAASMLQQG